MKEEMTLVDHLTELKTTLIRVIIILGVGFFVCYSYGDAIAEFLLQPLRSSLDKLDSGGKVIFLGVLDKVIAQFQVAFWSALILTSPLWFREIWSFIRPGLYPHEVKVIRPFIFLGFIFFALGVVFGYKIVFPLTFDTLLNFGVENVEAQMSLKEYLILCCKVLVFLGIVFQLPNVLLILGFMGVVTKQSLRSMRPYVYVAFSIVSAVLTPPDPLTMMMLWVPLVCLFEGGILGVAIIVHPWLRRQVEKEEAANRD